VPAIEEILYEPLSVLDHGFVRVIDYMGDDAAVVRIAEAWGTPRQAGVFQSEYETAEKISIDFAVMQEAAKAGKVLVIHAPYQWDDVGSWLALERRNPQDASGNTIQALHVGIKTSGCVIVSDPGTVVATIGVHNLLIIRDGDALLVADRRDILLKAGSIFGQLLEEVLPAAAAHLVCGSGVLCGVGLSQPLHHLPRREWSTPKQAQAAIGHLV